MPCRSSSTSTFPFLLWKHFNAVFFRTPILYNSKRFVLFSFFLSLRVTVIKLRNNTTCDCESPLQSAKINALYIFCMRGYKIPIVSLRAENRSSIYIFMYIYLCLRVYQVVSRHFSLLPSRTKSGQMSRINTGKTPS